ncbi:MAG: triose-phosphate isomerase [Bacteroidota bacterium]|nr:triose-phosphate isomerase [Bacteroidota bacterium]
MRKQYVIGNWKMNQDIFQTKELLNQLTQNTFNNKTNVLVAPSFVFLSTAKELLKNSAIGVCAQNLHQETSGAYTGEVSAPMLTSIGVQHVIIGHSERRMYFAENDKILTDKVKTALEASMAVIYCFGEDLENRKNNNYKEFIASQIKNVLFGLDAHVWENIILAYEPIWAIGTGETATPEQAQEIHSFIRNLIKEFYNSELAEKTSILYGGSVKADNAKEIFEQPDVDGGLIGGASLKATDFVKIIQSI